MGNQVKAWFCASRMRFVIHASSSLARIGNCRPSDEGCPRDRNNSERNTYPRYGRDSERNNGAKGELILGAAAVDMPFLGVPRVSTA